MSDFSPESVSQAIQQITRAGTIFLINHRRMDGDAYGSLQAMYGILKNFPQKKIFALNDMIPEETLLEFGENIFTSKFPNITPDLIISFDSGSVEQLGKIYETHTEIFQNTPWINIDHHISNNHFGTINLVDTLASSTCEIMWQLVQSWQWEGYVTQEIATFLMIGLVTDTNNFTNSNTTETAFQTATELMKCDANHQKIIQKFFKSKPLRRLRLGIQILNMVELLYENQLALVMIPQNIFQESGSTYEDLTGMLDEYFMKIENIEVGCLLAQLDTDTWKISTRTKSDRINLCDFCGKWGGGGHARASGCTIQKDGTTLKKELVAEFGKYFSHK